MNDKTTKERISEVIIVYGGPMAIIIFGIILAFALRATAPEDGLIPPDDLALIILILVSGTGLLLLLYMGFLSRFLTWSGKTRGRSI